MIDAAEPERFPLAKEELNKLLDEKELENVPILIFGNKIDRK
eukprot:CAMPEP_0170541480 /NCGR_PEP_ID=MMETSP0211-20121228/1204_1 /TAXON_ID=311385 /ORGANISM="Pseudokeronopsis sp., Strain OXSARD2" /LENGTH=41 /DNA_ID= /DNA_START= /DNA_END= /DNA_ORIENTATION=